MTHFLFCLQLWWNWDCFFGVYVMKLEQKIGTLSFPYKRRKNLSSGSKKYWLHLLLNFLGLVSQEMASTSTVLRDSWFVLQVAVWSICLCCLSKVQDWCVHIYCNLLTSGVKTVGVKKLTAPRTSCPGSPGVDFKSHYNKT